MCIRDRVKAIDDVSFDVKKSEFVGIMGPSGSGKTTLDVYKRQSTDLSLHILLL